jgi:hypothetical protein
MMALRILLKEPPYHTPRGKAPLENEGIVAAQDLTERGKNWLDGNLQH